MMRPRLSLMAASLALALAGCALGPDYQRPQAAIELPAAYAEGAQAPADSPALASQWWTLFGDAQLNQLVSQALAGSPDARSAAARIEEAEALLRQVDAALLPQVDLSATGAHTRYSQTTAVKTPNAASIRDSAKLNLATSFELDVWGKLRRSSEAAQAQFLGTRYAAETVYLSLAASVTQSYLSLRALDAQLALARDNLESQTQITHLTEKRQQGGIASALDVEQARSTLASYRSTAATLAQRRAVALSQLGLLVGQPGLQVAEGDLKGLPLPPEPPVGLPSSLLEARPDLRKAETDLIAANAKIGVAKAALFPGITLTGSFGRESKDLAQLFSAPSAIWSLGAGITQPIFEGGRLRARVEEVSAQQKQSLEAYRKAVQTAFREVNDALVTLHASAETEAAQQQTLDAARRTRDLTRLRHASGYAAYADVLAAERSSNEAAQTWLDRRQARLSAAVDLFKALGGGWKDERPLMQR